MLWLKQDAASAYQHEVSFLARRSHPIAARTTPPQTEHSGSAVTWTRPIANKDSQGANEGVLPVQTSGENCQTNINVHTSCTSSDFRRHACWQCGSCIPEVQKLPCHGFMDVSSSVETVWPMKQLLQPVKTASAWVDHQSASPRLTRANRTALGPYVGSLAFGCKLL